MSQIKFIVHEWELFMEVSTLSNKFKIERDNYILSYIFLPSNKEPPKQAPP